MAAGRHGPPSCRSPGRSCSCANPTSRGGWRSCRSSAYQIRAIGIGPWQAALNVTYFVLLHNVGILWIDALCRWYRDHRERFRVEVLLPLAIAAAVSCVVSIYQGYVDLTFLNTGFWAYMIRAGGTLGDPNKLGAIAAFWTVGSLVLARRAGTTACVPDGGRGDGARHCRSLAVGIANWPGRPCSSACRLPRSKPCARGDPPRWRGALVARPRGSDRRRRLRRRHRC